MIRKSCGLTADPGFFNIADSRGQAAEDGRGENWMKCKYALEKFAEVYERGS